MRIFTWEQRTVAYCELYFNVESVCWATIYKRRPQPVVDIVISHIAYHIAPPIYALYEVCERLFYPLK